MTTLLAKFHDFEVDSDGPYFDVVLPCYEHDYLITHTPDGELAVKEMKQFVAEAQAALEELEALVS